MDGYNRFYLDERNGYPQDRGAQIRIRASGPTSEATQTYLPCSPSLPQARAAIEASIRKRIERLEAELAGWRQQLLDIPTHYADIRTPGERLLAHRAEIVEAIRRYREAGVMATKRFSEVTFAFGYMGRHRDLVVVSLPEYDSISATFLKEDVDLLLQMFEEAGCQGPFSHWNGLHCYSWSVRLHSGNFSNVSEVAEAHA